jgi:hypothetical protein
MKKAFFLFFITSISFGQITTAPTGLGIGQNTNPLIPLHIKKPGQAISIDGTNNPFVSFYNDGSYAGYVQATENGLTIGTPSSEKTLEFRTNSTIRMSINADNGEIIMNERLNAQDGIDIVGPLRSGGTNTGQFGDILMSMGNGTPVWSSALENLKVGFTAIHFDDFIIPSNSFGIPSSFPTLLQIHEYGGDNFNPTTGSFTCPGDGLYSFRIKMVLKSVSSTPVHQMVTLGISVNGFGSDQKLVSYHTANFNQTLEAVLIEHLSTGNVVTFKTLNYFPNLDVRNLEIKGFKIH